MTRYIETAPGFNQTAETYKTGTYTITLADSLVNGSGTFTFTLPAISTINAQPAGAKTYKIVNTGTGIITVASVTGETIGGDASRTINAQNEFIIITANSVDTDWKVTYPAPLNEAINIKDSSITGAKLTGGERREVVCVETNGTTPVHIHTSAGADFDLTITGVFVGALDTTAGNIIVKNGTATVASVAKGTSTGVLTVEEAIANTSQSAGDAFTVESSTAGNASVWVAYETTK
jgi:hypothetical protein